MPSVPRYDGGVRQAPAPDARVATSAPLEAFGGNARSFDAASDLAGQGRKMAQEAQDQADHARLLEERRALNEWEYSNIYDPKTGAINKLGKDAFGIHESLKENYDKFLDERSKGLANDRQRMAFGDMAEARRDHIIRWADDHVAKQSLVVEESEYKAGIESSKERASVDPSQVPLEVSFIRNETINRARRIGMGAEETKQELQKQESDLHSRVIHQMIAGKRDMDAKAYYDKVAPGMDPDTRSVVKQKLDAAVMLGETQREATRLMDESKGDLGKALDGARKIGDAELQKSVVQEIKVRDAEYDRIKKDREEVRFKSAADYVEKTKDRPSALWGDLSLQERNALDARIKQLREGIKPETDWNDFYNLKTQAAYPATRDAFLRTNLMVYRPKMADAEFKELINLQAQLRQGDERAEKLLDGFRSDQQIVNDALTAAGVDVTSPKPGKDDSTRVNLFRQKVDQQIQQRQAATGKKATNEEVQSIVDNLLVEGVTKRGIANIYGLGWLMGDTKKKVYELQPGEKVAIEKKDIPRGELLKIEAALRRAGRQVTDDAVVELYNKRIQGMVR